MRVSTCFSALFIDVGTNYSVLDHTNLSFIYEDVLSPGPNADGEFVSSVQVETSRNFSIYSFRVKLHSKVETNIILSFTLPYLNV